jgi:hypothetical protein
MKFLAVVGNALDKGTFGPCSGCSGIILIEDTMELLKVHPLNEINIILY